MLPELLVLFSCINQTGCAETANVYKKQNPSIVEVIDNVENKAEQALQPFLVQYWAPIALYTAGREGSVRLTSKVALNLNQKNTLLLYTHNF